MPSTPFFWRDIRTGVVRLGDDLIMVRGHLQDRRAADARQPVCTEADRHLLHDMEVRVQVRIPELTVAAIEGVMKHVPYEQCRHVLPGLQKLVGVKVARGFTSQVRHEVGGVRGCAHLTSLILSLAPVAAQALFTLQTPRYEEKGRPVGDLAPWRHLLLNSCYLWAEDGILGRNFTGKEDREVASRGD